MLLRKLTLSFLAGLLVGVAVAVAGTLAQVPNSLLQGTNSASGVTFALQPGEIVGHEQIVRALIKNGTNEFLFVVPEGLRVQSTGQGMILMSSQDAQYFASVRAFTPPTPASELPQALREYVLEHYPGAKQPEELTAVVAGHTAIGLLLRQEVAGVVPQQVRILWAPFPAGVLEFVLAAPPDQLPAAQSAFDMILLSLRSNEQGKLQIIKRSAKS